MGELKIREIYNGWIVTDKEGEDWAFTEDSGEYLLHWLSENLGIVPSPQDTDSTETVDEGWGGEASAEPVQPMADLSGPVSTGWPNPGPVTNGALSETE